MRAGRPVADDPSHDHKPGIAPERRDGPGRQAGNASHLKPGLHPDGPTGKQDTAQPVGRLSETDRSWVAGLLEGDGCFYMAENSGKPPKPSPRVQLSMRDADVVQRIANITGTGSVYTYEPNDPRYRRAPQFVWRTTGQAAIDLMRELLPLMGERRSAKIREILDAWA